MGANTSRAQQTRRRVREQEQQLPRKADHPRKPLGGWDADAVAALVKHGRLAPPRAGADDPAAAASAECPICFLYFPKVNATGCCRQAICTACYLQVRPQAGGAECPFCGVEDFSAEARASEESKADVPVAHKVSMDETVATVSTDERGKLEEAIRVQQIEARRRGDAPAPVPVAVPPRRAWRRNGPQFILRRRGAPPGEGTQALPLDDVHRLLASLGDLQHVEDLMLLEAMQASMQDETERRARAASEGSEGDAPPAPPGAARDAGDADDAAFRLAVRASLRESGGGAAEEEDDDDEESGEEPEEESEDVSEEDTDDEAEAKEGRPGFLDELPAEPADAKE